MTSHDQTSEGARPHYLRVARALTLAALVPGCGASGAPAPAPITSAPTDAAVAQADASSAPHELADAGAPSDASGDPGEQLDAYAFSSGPIVPPELPEGFA